MRKIYGVGLGMAVRRVTAPDGAGRRRRPRCRCLRFASPIISSSSTTNTRACWTSRWSRSAARCITFTRTPTSGFPSGRRRCAGRRLGAKEIINIEPVDAEVRYSPALTHRVGNIGSTPFRNITVQIQSRDDVSPGASFLASPKPAGYQAKPALDNELVRVERLILEPGPVDRTLHAAAIGPADRGARRHRFPSSGPEASAHRVEMKAGRIRMAHRSDHPYHHQCRQDALRGHRSGLEVSLLFSEFRLALLTSLPSSHAHARDTFPAQRRARARAEADRARRSALRRRRARALRDRLVELPPGAHRPRHSARRSRRGGHHCARAATSARRSCRAAPARASPASAATSRSSWIFRST